VLGYELGMDQSRTRLAVDRLGQSESRLRESEARWELAGKIAGIAPWSWDAASGELKLSSRAREMFGLAGDGPTSIADWQARIPPRGRRARPPLDRSIDGAGLGLRAQLPHPDAGVVACAGSARAGGSSATAAGRLPVDARRVLRPYRRTAGGRHVPCRARGRPRRAVRGSTKPAASSWRMRARVLLFGYEKEQFLGMSFDLLVPQWEFRPDRRTREQGPPATSSGAPACASCRPCTATADRPAGGGACPWSAACCWPRSATSREAASEQESAQQRTELAHLSRVAVLGEMSARSRTSSTSR
jgi:PAS domain-containing protein